ncbi:helix-turn-helix domain-containing protein [Levilactobacillus zymae]|uniref:AraC family transcriptional regulator n=1 Tax=Levilactobacillus zymae TaxID=267363 RepID=UPI0028B81842|nr:helix-turn-helix domain-containing protein [Levilactobacillus zymae]MDT6979269.1 helix-turn-helix domain-containing protein [Levilactobacillus zymae]
MLDNILNQLMKLTKIEKEQLKNYEFHNDMPLAAYDSNLTKRKQTLVLNNYFFRNKNIYISKHNRYAPYPTHTHTFLEVNYMLRGEADEIVQGQPVHLNTGDLILLDVGCAHSIGYLGTNDLLINILFQDRTINIDLLNSLRSSRSVLYEFLVNRKIGLGNKSTYLLFRRENGREIQETLDRIIEEYYLQREYADTIIKSYLSILIAQLVRNYAVNVDRPLSKSQVLITQILQDINDNDRDISLGYIAKKYGYNRNYLSNLFRETVGETFSDVLTKQRILHAHTLLASTQMPVDKIITQVGMTNKTFFYKKYRQYYHKNPREKIKS